MADELESSVADENEAPGAEVETPEGEVGEQESAAGGPAGARTATATDPETAALESKINADPVLSAKIALADAERAKGNGDRADALYNEITKELGYVNPDESVPVSPLVAPAAQVDTEAETARYNLFKHNVERELVRYETEHANLTAQKQNVINAYNAQISNLMADPVDGGGGLSKDMAQKLANQAWGQQYDTIEAKINQAATNYQLEQTKDSHMRLIDANCAASPKLAAVKASYAEAAYQGKIDITKSPAVQLQQLEALGVKVPRGTANANTITRSTMDKLKGLKSPLSAGKIGSNAAPSVRGNEHGANKSALDYFAGLTGRKFA